MGERERVEGGDGEGVEERRMRDREGEGGRSTGAYGESTYTMYTTRHT